MFSTLFGYHSYNFLGQRKGAKRERERPFLTRRSEGEQRHLRFWREVPSAEQSCLSILDINFYGFYERDKIISIFPDQWEKFFGFIFCESDSGRMFVSPARMMVSYQGCFSEQSGTIPVDIFLPSNSFLPTDNLYIKYINDPSETGHHKKLWKYV